LLHQVAVLPDGLRISFGRCQTRGDVECVQRLFAAVDEPKPQELADWQYLEPSGGSYLAVAHDDRGPLEGGVAMYAAMPVPFQMGGRPCSAIQSFDTLTLPSHRGRGLFPQLAEIVYGEATKAGEILVFGVPNASSVGGFIKHLGWTADSAVPLRVRPVGLRYLRRRAGLRRITPPELVNCHPDERCSVPPDVEGLVQSSLQPSWGVRKTYDYLSWRLRRPGVEYRSVEVRGASGVLQAWGAACVESKHGATVGYLLTVLFRPDSAHAGRQALATLGRAMRDEGADLILSWSWPASPSSQLLLSLGYVPAPTWLRPIDLYFGYRRLTDTIPMPLLEVPSWDFSYLDSDTV
jgi:GNAT superfamily N-acetyltransferase